MVSDSAGPPAEDRAFTSASPPESTTIASTIVTNANRGIRMLVLQFDKMTLAPAAVFHAPSIGTCGVLTLAICRSSAPTLAYSFIRTRHCSHSETCTVVFRETGSPSNKAEISTAASSHFIGFLVSLAHRPARYVATLPALQTTWTSQFRQEPPEFPPAPRMIALRPRVATAMSVVLLAIAPARLL